MTNARDELLGEIEAFLQRNELPATTFGRCAVNDMSLVRRLREGSDVRTATADRLRKFMSDFEKPPAKRPGGRKARSACVTAQRVA